MNNLLHDLKDLGIEYRLFGARRSKILYGNISDDSRDTAHDTVFVAVQGSRFDSHEFVKGLGGNFVAAIIEEGREREAVSEDLTVISVSDTRKVLAFLSHRLLGDPSKNISSIGVTGTNGKTTVTYLIHYILQKAIGDTALIGTTGIFVRESKRDATHTTPSPRVLAALYSEFAREDISHCVMEVSSHSLHQSRVSGMEFDVAVFTNLTQDHLDYHGNMEEYARAKKILFDNLPPDSTAIVYSGDSYGGFMLQDTRGEKITCGFLEDDTYSIKEYSIGINGTKMKVKTPEGTFDLQVPLIGRFNIINTVLAMAACRALGVNEEKFAELIRDFAGVPGRMQMMRIDDPGCMAIVDYAHTPDALENVLETLCELPDRGKIIAVFGCGGDRDKGKRPLMGAVATRLSDMTIITNDNPRTENPKEIAKDIEKGCEGRKGYRFRTVLDRGEAIATALRKAEKGDIILIAGKGHEDYQIIGEEKIHFSDLEVLKMMATEE